MGLSRLDNFLKSVRGNVLYVDPNSVDSTDSIENQGNSLVRPFKTIQRALLEASRFSYQKGLDNDRFEKTSIVIYPGEHLIDNRPGWIPDGLDEEDQTQRKFRLRGGISSNNFSPFDGTTNFNLETDDNDLYKLNSIYGGAIIPRGVSLVGIDLRKTKIRPKYVPNPENDNIETASIFRLTGGCFIWNFTILDASPSGSVYLDYTLNKRLPNYSHNKLTVFEYADGVNPVNIKDIFYPNGLLYDRTDLDMYYEKVSIAYGASTNRRIDPTYPESGIDIEAVLGEYKIVGSRGQDYTIESIIAGDGEVSSDTITVTLSNPIVGLNVNTAIRISGIPTPGYNGSFVVSEIVDVFTIKYKASTAPAIPNPNISGFSTILSVIVDTVNSASPYIFNVSLRSVYGMCGLHADGDRADGFKSIVVAQFTGIGLQKDNNAFIKFNPITGIYEDSTLVSNLSSDSKAIYKPKYENYHIKASNDAFMQLVSVFAIGFANQFVVESGGDLSVTNSNSNFGSKALVASGFKRESFKQDDVGYITHIIPPREIGGEEISISYLSIDVELTDTANKPKRLYLYQETNQDLSPESVIDGYRIGAKLDETLNVIVNNQGQSSIVSSKIVMQVPESLENIVNNSSVKRYEIGSNNLTGLPLIENNIITLTSPHALINGEKIRILSSTGSLPNGVKHNEIYYAITFIQDETLSENQIKIAKSFNDAIGNNPIDINDIGEYLIIESRVSDKSSGEIGHPIQWDNDNENWYITVDSNPANNQIYSQINNLKVDILGESTSRTFIKRILDDRNLIDTVYRLRYVIPKDSPVSSRPPIDGFIIQESNDTTSSSKNEIEKYFNINRNSEIIDSNPYEVKNFKFIASALWTTGIARFTTELPHKLSLLSEVEIKNVTSTSNPEGLDNVGFNGNFVVIDIIDSKTFDVEIPVNPGLFTNDTTDRDVTLPFFRRKRFKDTYSIFQKEEIQEYIPGQKDGIYHLFVTSNSISPQIEPFTDLKLSQPTINFYPQKNRDNPKSESEFTISYALPDTIGKVAINNPENSITNESLEKFIVDTNIGIDIFDIQSNSTGVAHTIFTSIDHGLNRIVKLTQITTGNGYGTGEFTEQVFYNAKLVGSATGEGATATVKVSDGKISDILIIDGGSGYQLEQTVSVVGIATTTNFQPAVFEISQIYNNINANIKIDGIFASPYEVYNGVYRITSVLDSKKIEVVSEKELRANTAVGSVPIIQENPFGLRTKNPEILKFTSGVITGESARITGYVYDTNSGIATVTTQLSNGIKVDNKVVVTGFTAERFNGDFSVKRVVTVSRFEIFVGKGIQETPSLSTNQYVNRPGVSSAGGSINFDSEESSGRLVINYGNLKTTLSQALLLDSSLIYLNNIVNLDLKIGDYLLVDYEIVRIKKDLPKDINPLNGIEVFRGLLGTIKRSHAVNSYVERINVLPIEFRRNSIIRASGHTFEYVGFGPGNYSTTLPENQDRVLSKVEESLAQSLRTDGGLNVYTGMNDSGSFYIGNKRILSSGKEEIFDAPIPTITGEDPTSGTDNIGLNLINSDELRVANAIRVEGGSNNNTISEFDGPVVFNSKITSNSNIEVSSLFLRGDANVSRNYNIGISTPIFAGNPGDVVFDANPESGGDVGWVYTISNKWEKFGPIKDNDFYNGKFKGVFVGDGSQLDGVSDIWTVDATIANNGYNGIFYTGNAGIATNRSLPDFALHIFGGIKANGISEFNSRRLTFNVPDLVDLNATTTRISQSFDVVGVSTFKNNIFLQTIQNNTDGRHLRFVQTDTTIINNQGYGGIEWEGRDTGNTGLRGYIHGISEGTLGQFALSFATQGSGLSSPQERLRLKSDGSSVFSGDVTGDRFFAPNSFYGNLVGIADTASNAILTRVEPDATNSLRFVTFVANSTEGFYGQRSSNKIRFNPSTGDLYIDGRLFAAPDPDPGDDISDGVNVRINAGDGLSGGGLLTQDRTLSVDSTVVRTTRTINTNSGSGLTGGGDLSANRSLSVDSTVVRTTENQTIDGVKTFGSVIQGTITTATNATNSTNLSRSILAGDGLSGGGLLDRDRTLNVDSTVVRTTRTINTNSGSGLTGGGDLSANRSLSVDSTVVRTTGKQTIDGVKTFTSTINGTITTATNLSRSILAGDGLSGGGLLDRDRTLNVGAGSGISVSSTSVSVDDTVVRTSGAQDIGGRKNFTSNTTATSITASGTVSANVFSGGGIIPIGGIIMWKGSIANIPARWALCDGNNGTPNLRDRFIVGAGNQYSPNNTGGANTVTLTVSQIPSHDHPGSSADNGSHTHTGKAESAGAHTHTFTTYGRNDYSKGNNTALDRSKPQTDTTNSAGAHTHTLSIDAGGTHRHTITVGPRGGGGSHENRPPYYALAFIMRLS
jgi:microcystin-dependent protein